MPVRLLCDAIPFCYGPAAALETLLKELLTFAPDQFEIAVLASGSTREFLERSHLPIELLQVDSEDPAALAALDVRPYQALLDVCNPASFRALRPKGLPVIYVDFLLWMHTGPAPDYFAADLYLAENYPGTRDWLQHRRSEVPHLALVPPLIQTVVRKPIERTLLVGLGGMYSRLTVPGVNTDYAAYVVQQILPILQGSSLDRAIIAGPRGLERTFGEILPAYPRIQFRSLSHQDFLAELSRCERFLSHPGLYAPFEAMLSGVPTAFLPPSNYTQILQLRHFRDLGIADLSLSWDDFGDPPIPADLPEAEGVAAVLQEIARAQRSVERSRALQEMLSRFLDLGSEAREELGQRQQRLALTFRAGPSAAERFHQWCSAHLLGMAAPGAAR